MRESQVEKYLNDEIVKLGGVTFKWLSTTRGVPDRIVFVKGQVWFIEVKTIIGKLSPMQIRQARIITQHTPNYAVLRSKDDIDQWVSNL